MLTVKTITMEENGESDSAMDKLLWLIKDDLPKSVLSDIRKLLDQIPGVKSVQDMKVFVLIEFHTKAEAIAARERGFTYKLNGQDYNCKYSNDGTVGIYMNEKFKNVQTGYN